MICDKKTNYENQFQTQWTTYKEQEWNEPCYEEHGEEYWTDFKGDFVRQVCEEFDGPFDVEFFRPFCAQDDQDNEETCRRGMYWLVTEWTDSILL